MLFPKHENVSTACRFTSLRPYVRCRTSNFTGVQRELGDIQLMVRAKTEGFLPWISNMITRRDSSLTGWSLILSQWRRGLSDSGRRRRARPKHESARCIKVIFNTGSLVSVKSNGIRGEKRYSLRTLLAAPWRISNWLARHINLQLLLVTHSTSVLLFVLGISSGSSTTFSRNFHHGTFCSQTCVTIEQAKQI